MARKAVVDAVEARLAALWTACPIRGLNSDEGDAPGDASAFLVVQYPVANETPITVGAPGANLWREEGAFRLVLQARRGSGVQQALEWADQLADLFRGKDFDGVRTFGPSSPSLDDRNDAGNFWVVSISVPYQHDLIG